MEFTLHASALCLAIASNQGMMEVDEGMTPR